MSYCHPSNIYWSGNPWANGYTNPYQFRGFDHGTSSEKVTGCNWWAWANICPRFIDYSILVGGIPTPLKNMSSSVGMILPNIWKNKMIQTTNQIVIYPLLTGSALPHILFPGYTTIFRIPNYPIWWQHPWHLGSPGRWDPVHPQSWVVYDSVLSTSTIIIIELDYGKIYRKALYLMVETMVSSRFSLKPIQWH